jgi:hypothetical protein
MHILHYRLSKTLSFYYQSFHIEYKPSLTKIDLHFCFTVVLANGRIEWTCYININTRKEEAVSGEENLMCGIIDACTHCIPC